MSIALGAATNDGLSMAADSRFWYLTNSQQPQPDTGSKVTPYSARGGTLLVAFTGLWDGDLVFERYEAALALWAATERPLSSLGDMLAEWVAWPLTQEACKDELRKNLSEMLIGFVAPDHPPELLHVLSSKTCARIPIGRDRAIGGDPFPVERSAAAPPELPGVGPHLLNRCRAIVSGHPHKSYGYPIQLVQVSSSAPRKVVRQFCNEFGAQVRTPPNLVYLPPKLKLT